MIITGDEIDMTPDPDEPIGLTFSAKGHEVFDKPQNFRLVTDEWGPVEGKQW